MADKQLLHLVFGGRVKDPQTLEFENLDDIDIVGVYPNFKSAEAAWRGASQLHVDDAMCRPLGLNATLVTISLCPRRVCWFELKSVYR